jgi:hypothetical protein
MNNKQPTTGATQAIRATTLALLGGVVAFRVMNDKNIAVKNFEKDYITPLDSILTPQEKEILKLFYRHAIELEESDIYYSFCQRIAMFLATKYIKLNHGSDITNALNFYNQCIRKKHTDKNVEDFCVVMSSVVAFEYPNQAVTTLEMCLEKNGLSHRTLSALGYPLRWELGSKIASGLFSKPQNAFHVAKEFNLTQRSKYDLDTDHYYRETADYILPIASVSPKNAVSAMQEMLDYIIPDYIGIIPTILDGFSKTIAITSITLPKETRDVVIRIEKHCQSVEPAVLYGKGKLWVSINEEKGISIMHDAIGKLKKSTEWSSYEYTFDLWNDIGNLLIFSNLKRAKHIARKMPMRVPNNDILLNTIAYNMVLGLIPPEKEFEERMGGQVFAAMSTLSRINPTKAYDYLRRLPSEFVLECAMDVMPALVAEQPDEAQKLYEEIMALVELPPYRQDKTAIMGDAFIARLGIPCGSTYHYL